MSEFIAHLAKPRKVLSSQLKKDAPPWTSVCTTAVQKLKQVSKTLPSLQIPSTGKRILQTDASDHYWGAVLLEENETTKQRRICGYKSGAFTTAELHYHSTYKEIRAVMKAIEKFKFHLIGHHFLIETDLSSFPQMIKFKQKALPPAQLLRWANWFSQWTFDVTHIKGKNNTLADFLSRKKCEIQTLNPKFFPPFIPMIACLDPLPLPPHLQLTILEQTLISRSCHTLHSFLKLYIYRFGIFNGPIQHLPFHPVYPFLTLFHFNDKHVFKFPQEAYHLLWYLCDLYTIGITFDKTKMLYYLAQCQLNDRRLSITELKFSTWLTQFGSLQFWQDTFHQSPWKYPIILFSAKPRVFHTEAQSQSTSAQVQAHEPAHVIARDFQTSVLFGYESLICLTEPSVFHSIKVQLCFANSVDPTSIPSGLLLQQSNYWKNVDLYPPDYVDIINDLLFGFAEQYTYYNYSHRDHPCYRVDCLPYPLYRQDRFGNTYQADPDTDDESSNPDTDHSD